MSTKTWSRRRALTAVLGVALCLSLAANAYLSAANRRVSAQLGAQRQQALADVVSAMADIEVNLQKLMIASGASQSVSLLGETALLARHVETGLSQLPMRYEGASDAAAKFDELAARRKPARRRRRKKTTEKNQ